MSLSDFITKCQSFSVEYTPKYGELNFEELEKDKNINYYLKKVKPTLKLLQDRHIFSNNRVYIIHCFIHAKDDNVVLGVFVDNFGFTYDIYAGNMSQASLMTDKIIDCAEHKYPLPNLLIDAIKQYNILTPGIRDMHNFARPIKDIYLEQFKTMCYHYRNDAVHYYERDILKRTILEIALENASMKKKLAIAEERLWAVETELRAFGGKMVVEASSPSEDLLGLSNIVIETMTEPSKN